LTLQVVDALGDIQQAGAIVVDSNDMPSVSSFPKDTLCQVGTSLRLNVIGKDLGYLFYYWSSDGKSFKQGRHDTTISLPTSLNGNFWVYVVTKDGDNNSRRDSLWIVLDSTFTDMRDGQPYHAVRIGSQVWMAKNLNFTVDSSWWYNGPDYSDEGNTYNDSLSSGSKFGRLYKWTALMGIADSCKPNTCTIPTSHRGICPQGWHVPSDTDWTTLVGEVQKDSRVGSGNAGRALKAKSAWTCLAFTLCPVGRAIPAAISMMLVTMATGGLHPSATPNILGVASWPLVMLV
jgi:uncharacterized protein (TIGR02145 family)